MDPSTTPGDAFQGLIAKVARSLNEKGIPCILWARLALGVHGYPGGGWWPAIDLVVRDDDVQAVRDFFQNNNQYVEQCREEDKCLGAKRKQVPYPAYHTHPAVSHVDAQLYDTEITFYRQSEAWWWMPPLPREFANPRAATLDPGDYVLVDDETSIATVPDYPHHGIYRYGTFARGQYPVIAPTVNRLFESTLRLHARHFPAFDSGLHCLGYDMFSTMWQLYDDGIQDRNRLHAPCKDLFLDKVRDDTPPVAWVVKLRRAFGEPVLDEEETRLRHEAELFKLAVPREPRVHGPIG